eukprot:3520251-Amphidinium_carterae.1
MAKQVLTHKRLMASKKHQHERMLKILRHRATLPSNSGNLVIESCCVHFLISPKANNFTLTCSCQDSLSNETLGSRTEFSSSSFLSEALGNPSFLPSKNAASGPGTLHARDENCELPEPAPPRVQ